MQLLVIGYVWPESRSSGAGMRIMEWIHLFLEHNWNVHVTSPAARTEHANDLDALGVQSSAIELNANSFDDFITTLNPDVVLFDRFMMEEQFGWRVEKQCPHALRLLETIDLHCLREARHQQVKRTAEVVCDVPTTDLYSDMAKREIAAIWRSDLSLLISDYEVDLLQEAFGLSPDLIHHCGFMLDTSHRPAVIPSFEARQHFMTIGNFRHAPNWDAVLWLKQVIWPMIRAKLPKAELHIYGAYAPPKATAIHAPKDGFLIEGRAEDALHVMQQARICLAPLRFGGGIKSKLADAMLAGTPSITTSVGAEAMTGGLPWNGVVADEAEAFAQAAVSLYQDKSAWLQAQQHGFAILETWFNKQKNEAALMQRIEQLLGRLEEHRLKNFTGAMLRHHHHRSTEFMSRWIEAKNNPTIQIS